MRPALTRALAAHADDPKVRQTMEGLVMQGQAFFRSVVIEALGDHRAAYAIKPITEVAKIDGPLQDDAVLALGKIGDKASLPVLAGLQRTAPRESQPGIAAAICLLGVNCASHQPYIVDSLRFAIANLGFQELLRSSASALSVLAVAGREDAARELVEQGAPTRDPTRAPIALALGTVALRNAPIVLKLLEREAVREPGHRVAARGFRHARGRLRRGAVLRDRPPRLLAGPGRLAGASRRRHIGTQARVLGLSLIRGASPLGLPYTRSRAPLRRRAPIAWLARTARSHLETSVRFMR